MIGITTITEKHQDNMIEIGKRLKSYYQDERVQMSRNALQCLDGFESQRLLQRDPSPLSNSHILHNSLPFTSYSPIYLNAPTISSPMLRPLSPLTNFHTLTPFSFF